MQRFHLGSLILGAVLGALCIVLWQSIGEVRDTGRSRALVGHDAQRAAEVDAFDAAGLVRSAASFGSRTPMMEAPKSEERPADPSTPEVPSQASEPCACRDRLESLEHYLRQHFGVSHELSREVLKTLEAERGSLARQLRDSSAAVGSERSRIAHERLARGAGRPIDSDEKIRVRDSEGTPGTFVGDKNGSRVFYIRPEEDVLLGQAVDAHAYQVQQAVGQLETLIASALPN